MKLMEASNDPFAREFLKGKLRQKLNGTPKSAVPNLVGMLTAALQMKTGIPTPEKSTTDAYWNTKDGRQILVSQMDTRHLFNSLRMMYNRICNTTNSTRIYALDITVPPSTQLTVDKRILSILFYQMGKRLNELDPAQIDGVLYMSTRTRKYL